MFEKKDYGVLLENTIFKELYSANNKIACFKEKKECDFIVNNNAAIQVCFDVSDAETLKREKAGLKEACKYFNLKEGYIITHDQKDELKEDGITIFIIPGYEFVLKTGDALRVS